MKRKHANYIATVTFLDRKQVDYLDTLGKDYFFKYGHKLSRGRILSEMVSLLMSLGISLDQIDLENKSLSKAILKVIKDEGQVA